MVHARSATCLSARPNSGFAELPSGITYQWFRDGRAIINGDGGASPGGAKVSGAFGVLHATEEVHLYLTDTAASDAGNYTVAFSNSCQTVASAEALLTVFGECPGDLNGDDLVEDSDFSIFVVAYNILDCADLAMGPDCPADLNTDAFVDDADFSIFVVAYNALLCP